MSKSIDFVKIKSQITLLSGIVRRKFAYFMASVNRFGFTGIAWWFKTHGQIDELEIALADLRAHLEQDGIDLLIVERTLTDFIIPEEDLGHAYWYTEAHNKLVKFEEHLTEKKQVNIKLLKLAMNELKYISQSDNFHQIYQLTNIQQRVKIMYQDLQQKIVEQQSLEKQQLDADKQKYQVALAQQDADKAASIAKAKMMESIKIKEKRLAIIEEKKRQIIEKEVVELKIKEQNEQAEIHAKQAEIERQTKLQQSYRELELKEKIKELPLEELIEMVNQQIVNKKILTFIQLDQLAKLKHSIEDKKAE